jgi:hypothetical protein
MAEFLAGRFGAGAAGQAQAKSLNDFALAPVGPVTLPFPDTSQVTTGTAKFGAPRIGQRTVSDPPTFP